MLVRRDRQLLGRLALCIAVLSPGGLVTRAHAQQQQPSAAAPATPAKPAAAPTPAQLAEAKKFFTAGLKLMKEQLYQEALASFLEANRIAPRESIQNNIALCYRNLKDFAAAYEAYDALLATYGDKMKPGPKGDAQRALEELAVLTGVISIGVAEPGAKATIDGKDVGTTPIAKPIRVNIGTHQVSVTKAGLEPIAQQVEIRGHDTASVNGPMQKEILTGHVTVTLQPADPTAKVIVDGKEVGPAPWQGDLDPGIHQVEARGEKTAAPQKPIEVQKKGNVEVTLDLHAQQGTVAVNVNVADAQITIDGKPLAQGVWEGPLDVGKHEVAVAKAGYLPYKKELLVHDGDRVVENVALQRELSAAQIQEAPHDWTGVYAQLNFVGQFGAGQPTNDVAQGVGYPSNATINGTGAVGGGLNVRVGYSFGFIGLEGSIMGGYDHSSASVSQPASGTRAAFTENWDFHRAGGTAAIAVRLMPKTDMVRPTLGVGGGLSLRGMIAHRGIDGQNAATPPSDVTSGFTTYLAPALVLDGGIELGSTPGTRFYLGALMTAEFTPATPPAGVSQPMNTTYPVQSTINLVNGTELFIGPILGMQFGE